MTPPDRARSWVSAAFVAVVVAATVGLAGHLLLDAGLRQSRPTLEDATRTGAMAVGQAVAAQFAYALELGIPLEKMPGVDAYLERIVAGSPQVEGLALIDDAGQTVASTGEVVEGTRFAIVGGDAEAELVVEPESPFLDRAVRQMRMALAIAAAFAGMLAGSFAAYFFAFRYEPARRQMLDDLGRVVSGDFDVRPAREDRGPMGQAARALALCLERVAAARRTLLEAAATIRAIDFDGSLGRRVDSIMQPIEKRYRFPRRDDEDAVPADSDGSAWRIALVLCLYCAAFPYVANFAIDREPDGLPAAWIPVLPLLAELAGALVGASLARSGIGRSRLALAVACLGLAACLAATYWCRDYDPFVMLRAGSGFAGGFVVAALLTHHQAELRRTDLAALAIFAALFAGPLLAGLYAEAIGRRSGFLMLGLAMLAATPFVAAGAGRTAGVTRRGARRRRIDRSDLLLGLSIIPASAMVLVVLPASIAYDDYLLTGSAVAVMAICALAVPALSPLVGAAALFAAGLALHDGLLQKELAVLLGCALLGTAAGGAVKAFGGNRPWTALAAGTAAALLATGFAVQFPLGFAAVPFGAAILLIACWPLTRRSGAAEPA